MSEEVAAEKGTRHIGYRMLFWLIVALLVTPVLWLLLILAGGPATLNHLLLGWIQSAPRIAGNIEFSRANYFAWSALFATTVTGIVGWGATRRGSAFKARVGSFALLALGLSSLVCLSTLAVVGILNTTIATVNSDEPFRVYKTGGDWAGDVADQLIGLDYLSQTNGPVGELAFERIKRQWAPNYRAFRLEAEREGPKGLIVWKRPESYGPELGILIVQGRRSIFRTRQLPAIVERHELQMQPLW